MLASLDLQAAAAAQQSDPAVFLLLLIAMALLPFVLTMITSFAKIVIVGGILRQALGMPQIPPTSVLTGIALILTIHIMSPVAARVWQAVEPTLQQTEEADLDAAAIVLAGTPPVREFLEAHSETENVGLFRSLRGRLAARDAPALPSDVGAALETLTVYAPAFILSELTEAFQIGFLLFVPFLILDLVVSNILLALGMHMLSPVTISLPLKLLLFVLVDGWRLILEGVVLGYAR